MTDKRPIRNTPPPSLDVPARNLRGREKATVFISFSHKDERWKDRLGEHLGVLAMEGLLDVWDDRRITAGQDWLPEVEKAMAAARVAVLLISASFLTSKFIPGEEVPRLLQRRIEEGLMVLPVIVRDCPWRRVAWLESIQSRPRDGRALASFRGAKREEHLAAIAVEIAALLERPTSVARGTASPAIDPVELDV